MGRNLIETVMGAVVLVIAGLFVSFAYRTAQVEAIRGYEIKAAFHKIGGLQKGNDVRVSGIKVGTVTDHRLDPETFNAVVTMSIENGIRLPADTAASISSEGMLGAKYVRLEPGTAKESLKPGVTIAKTKEYRSLEDQVGEIIFLATGGEQKGTAN
jgi:phospholipid/cholesterol/gamma-HCH transport system substrate-binding protein